MKPNGWLIPLYFYRKDILQTETLRIFQNMPLIDELMSYHDVLYKEIAWESPWKTWGLLKMNSTKYQRWECQGQGAISYLWCLVSCGKFHKLCFYWRGDGECLKISIHIFVKASVTYRLFMLIGNMLAYLDSHYNFFKHLKQVI